MSKTGLLDHLKLMQPMNDFAILFWQAILLTENNENSVSLKMSKLSKLLLQHVYVMIILGRFTCAKD